MRACKWDTPLQLHCFATFGGVDIDFTHEVWTSDQDLLDTYAVFGGVTVKVPAGVEVIDHTFAIFGARCPPPRPVSRRVRSGADRPVPADPRAS
jgi:hypothetical protein